MWKLGLSLILIFSNVPVRSQDSTASPEPKQWTEPPALIHGATPKYPKLARKAKIQGTVTFKAIIGKDGRLKDVTVIDGDPLLIHEAEKAVRKWRYKPARYDGAPIEVETKIGVDFKLEEEQAAVHQQPATTAPGTQTSDGPSANTSTEVPTGPVYGVGHGVTPPRPIYRPDPQYDEKARLANEQGTVILSLIVTPDGQPRAIRLVRSNVGYELVQRAIDAVRTWKFEPAIKDGLPVAVQVNVEVSFKLYRQKF